MSYIVISKELFKNPLYKHLSPEAKLLYGFLLDRSKLSEKNGDLWLDKNNEHYIYYTQAEVMERFRCSHDKASRLMKEVESVGLIQRTPQGLGKPHRLVVRAVAQSANSSDRSELNFGMLDSGKIAANNTYDNNSDVNKSETNLLRDKVLIEKRIKENVYYDVLATETDQNILDGIIGVIVETLGGSSGAIRIAGEQRSAFEVYHNFMKLNDMHLRYIIDRIKREENVIFSPKGYILRHLFYASQEMDVYYASRVAHDEKTRRNG